MPPFLSSLAGKIVLIVVLIAGAGWYYYHTQSTITELEQNVQILKENEFKLEKSNESQKETIQQLQDDIEKRQEAEHRLRKKNEIYERSLHDLETKLNRTKSGEKRDLSEMMRRKKSLMENIINRGSKERARCFEIASGDKVTEEERNVKNSKRNRVCPELFDYPEN